jgi:hypothetical protein
MSGIGKGLHTYATEGNQGMPISAHQGATADNVTVVQYMGAIGSKRGQGAPNPNPSLGEIIITGANDGTKVSTTRNLWTLIRAGGSTPGSFTCPSSEDAKNDEDSPQDFWDFGVGNQTTESTPKQQAWYKQVSYGYQQPYGRLGKPSAENDQRAVLAADKGPWSNISEEYTGGPSDIGEGKAPKLTDMTINSSPDDWRKYNSPNHGGVGDGEGQNVLYADSHAEWMNKPTGGPAQDNIYTQWGGGPTAQNAGLTIENRIRGVGPSSSNKQLAPLGNTDGLIYP